MVQIAEAKPPYVTFEVRAEEDRQASIESGHYVARDVTYAMITPRGSRDRIERVADEWFALMAREVDAGRYPLEWLEHFRKQFEYWKKGQEAPLEGHDIRAWPPLSPSQIEMLTRMGVRTVEELASSNEETLNRIGMGSRGLKAKASDWLQSSKDSGKLAEDLAKLRAENENLLARNRSLEAQIAEIAADVKALGEVKSKKL